MPAVHSNMSIDSFHAIIAVLMASAAAVAIPFPQQSSSLLFNTTIPSNTTRELSTLFVIFLLNHRIDPVKT